MDFLDLLLGFEFALGVKSRSVVGRIHHDRRNRYAAASDELLRIGPEKVLNLAVLYLELGGEFVAQFLYGQVLAHRIAELRLVLVGFLELLLEGFFSKAALLLETLDFLRDVVLARYQVVLLRPLEEHFLRNQAVERLKPGARKLKLRQLGFLPAQLLRRDAIYVGYGDPHTVDDRSRLVLAAAAGTRTALAAAGCENRGQ
jgi:hypothetical protein